ncbi:hypothetical protein IU449_21195 [Nocardia higoensis]|uniref:Transcriptional regulator n=1 Tax=Nocardia higoensis TaxID=228599 RepID=A0ABS0DK09_9NOCA|nr:hypothetical protein [Nocardia higoensis]MBF6357028.1 hypothetical protein [Nocardia higoensis]
MVRAQEWTGFEAVALQEAMRRSVRDFASLLGVETTTVNNWRAGLGSVVLRTKTQEILDTALRQRASDEDRARFEEIVAAGQTAWEERRQRQRRRATALPQVANAATVELSPPVAAEEVSVDRKRFLQVMTGSVAGLVLGPSALNESCECRTYMADSPLGSLKDTHTPPELVDHFHVQLAGHYAADAFLGPLHLIPAVQAQTELIIQLASEADSLTRCGLLETGAAYAALLGWLHQDAGNLAASTQWRYTTLALAHRSGEQQVISYALSNMAMLALDLDDGRVVVDYARAAQSAGQKLSPKCRVIALQHEAQGHAMLGDRATADRLLDNVAALTARVDDEHPWGNACRRTPHHVEVQRAISYGRTGTAQDAADAAALWDEIMDSMPELARRDNAVFRARQSAALAKMPDPDRAVWAATEAAKAFEKTGSARLRRELKALLAHSSAWAHTSAGRELQAIVGSLA